MTTEPQDTGSDAGQPVADHTATAQADWQRAFEKLTQTLDKRFEGVSAKFKEISQPKETSAPKEQAPVTREDLFAAIELGSVLTSLPTAARERISSLGESGKSITEQLATAKLLAEFAPANGAQHSAATPIPPGNAATAAPRSSPLHPKTLAEWMTLRKLANKDPAAQKRWEALEADPAFDPTLLR